MKTHYGSKLIYISVIIFIINLQQFLLLPIISRNLGVENYGIWSQLFTAINFLILFALLALPDAFVRYTAGIKDRVSIAKNYYTILLFILVFCFIFAALFYLLSDFIIQNFIKTNKNIKSIVQLSALLIIAQGITQYTIGYFRTFQMEKLYSFFQIFQTAGILLFVIIYMSLGYGLFEIILIVIIFNIFILILSQLIIIKQIGIVKPNIKLLKTFLIFSLPLLPVSIFNWVINASDRYVVGYYFPVTEVAKYSAAYTVSMVIQLFYAPFYMFLLPKLTELWEAKNYSTLHRVLHYSNKLPLLIAIPALFGLGILGKEILFTFIRVNIEISFLLIPVISLGYILYFIGWYYVQVFILVEKTSLVMKGHLIAAIFNLMGNLILVPLIGILGAAIITLLTFFIQMIYFRYKSRNFYDIQLKWGFLWKSISASVVMSICILLLKSFIFQAVSIPVLIILILIGAIVYTIVAALLGVFQREEYDFVKSLFSR